MRGIPEETEFMPVLLDSMTDMVMIVRTDLSVAKENGAMKRRFGDGVGKRCYRALGCAKRCDGCAAEAIIEGRGSVVRQTSIGGSSYSVSVSPLRDESGFLMGYLEVLRDVTGDIRARDELVRANNKLREDLSMARALQRSMFRKRFPAVGEYTFSMGFYPCEAVGGDACDCMQLKDGRLLFYVADVSGHGVRAAMLTIFLKQEMIMLARQTEHIELKQMLREVRESFMELDAGEWTYITLFAALIDPGSGELLYINAGHSVAPIIKTRDGVRELYMPGAPVCSWSDEPGSEVGVFAMDRGDRLMLFTDGMTDIGEKSSEELLRYRFGEDPFDADAFIKRLKDLHKQNPNDDLLIMICERLQNPA